MFTINETEQFESNYDPARFMQFTEDTYDILDSLLLNRLLNLPTVGTFKITDRNAYRPDLLSLDIYGSMELWQYLLQFNGIIDVLTLHKDVTLSYFSIEEFNSLFLTIKQGARGGDIVKR